MTDPFSMPSSERPALRLPPETRNPEGRPRRLGIELEFGDLTLNQATEVVHGLFGGRIESRDAYRNEVVDTEVGDFLIELDAVFAHAEPGEGMTAELEEMIAERIGDVAKLWLPMEIACPPVEIGEIDRVEKLVEALRDAGATGTAQQLYYAFGCQFNPEVPSLDIAVVLRQFRAYLLLEDWLRMVSGRDISRRVLYFANPFPRRYARAVLARGYDPDWAAFIDDYLEDNPTRNRDLDLLPLFAHLDRERLERRLADPRVKARPTYHYRVPDSRIDEPDWSLTLEWNRWVLVEELAEDAGRFEDMRKAFLERANGRNAWASEVEKWLPDQA